MATCPRCAEELPTGYGSVCPNCGFVVRIPGVVKLGLTLLVAGLVVTLAWTFTADALFAGLWNLVNAVLVQPLGLRPAPFALGGVLKQLYDFVFGTADQAPWGGILVIAAGLVVCAVGGAYVRRAEGGAGLPA